MSPLKECSESSAPPSFTMPRMSLLRRAPRPFGASEEGTAPSFIAKSDETSPLNVRASTSKLAPPSGNHLHVPGVGAQVVPPGLRELAAEDHVAADGVHFHPLALDLFDAHVAADRFEVDRRLAVANHHVARIGLEPDVGREVPDCHVAGVGLQVQAGARRHADDVVHLDAVGAAARRLRHDGDAAWPFVDLDDHGAERRPRVLFVAGMRDLRRGDLHVLSRAARDLDVAREVGQFEASIAAQPDGLFEFLGVLRTAVVAGARPALTGGACVDEVVERVGGQRQRARDDALDLVLQRRPAPPRAPAAPRARRRSGCL
jgi:hypothetical protein